METKSLFQKGGCKISHSVSLGTKAIVLEKPGSDPLAHLEKPPEEAGATGTPSRVGDCWLQPVWGACFTVWTPVLESAI